MLVPTVGVEPIPKFPLLNRLSNVQWKAYFTKLNAKSALENCDLKCAFEFSVWNGSKIVTVKQTLKHEIV